MSAAVGRDRRAGFSVSELLVVVAILGIFITVSIPALSQFMRSYSAKTGTDEFVANMRLARHLAIARHQTISVTVNPREYSIPDWNAPNPSTAPQRTQRLPPGCSIISGTGTVTFRSDGTVSTGATSIRLQVQIDDEVAARCDVSVAPSGKVSSVFTRVSA